MASLSVVSLPASPPLPAPLDDARHEGPVLEGFEGGLADPAAPDTPADERHADEARPEVADGREREPHRGGALEAQGLPAAPDGEGLPGTEREAERQEEAEGGREVRPEEFEQGQGQKEPHQGLDGILPEYGHAGHERSALPVLRLRVRRAQGHGDERDIEQVVHELAEAVGAVAEGRHGPVVERQQDEARGQGVRHHEALQEAELRAQEGGKEERHRNGARVDHDLPGHAHPSPLLQD